MKSEDLNIINKLTPWRSKSEKVDSWHSMCSYLGSFPPHLSSYFIKHFSNEKDIIFDPFSGRGTTIVEGARLGRHVLATDLNPIALALSSAKSRNIKKEDNLVRIEELRGKYDSAIYIPEAKSEADDIHQIFHPHSLAQLCYLKRRLLKRRDDVDQFLIGVALGILHGGERKNGTSGYASISMPNTFSMSPEYVRKYVQQKKLQRVNRDIFSILSDKVERLFQNHDKILSEVKVVRQDVKSLLTNEEIAPYLGKVKAIITSPPYLGVVNYAKQNWIRSWFLNEDPDDVHKSLDDDLGLNEWIKFSRSFLKQLKKLLRKDGIGVFVIGDVARSRESVIPLAREFATLVNQENIFKNVWVLPDKIGDQDKTTRIWGETKGSATAIDRIVIVSDNNPFLDKNNELMDNALNYDLVQELTKEFL